MVIKDGSKMSKSKGNVVDPTEMFAKYGADTTRLYILFAAPPEKDLEWSDAGVEGASRFLGRVYRLVAKHSEKLRGVEVGSLSAEEKASLSPEERRLLRKAHQTLRHVTEDMAERWHFNTDIAIAMELVNELTDLDPAVEAGKIRPAAHKTALEFLVAILSLFTPHISDELWEGLGHDEPLLKVPWPVFDAELAAEDELEYPVQINGKLRSRIRVPVTATEDEIRTQALADEKVIQHLAGLAVMKMIVVPQKLVSIVAKSRG
jgi:leucyl-tRNA synthetase